mgnify:CR=1 FL=1
MNESNHVFDWDGTKIMDHEPNYNRRLFSEMIFINSNKNNINKKEDISKLNRIYNSLFI